MWYVISSRRVVIFDYELLYPLYWLIYMCYIWNVAIFVGVQGVSMEFGFMTVMNVHVLAS